MSLEQRLTEKLRPHADRVAEGRHNEFDFLPAALLHGLEHGRTTSEAVTEFRTSISTNVVIFERHLADAAKSRKESSQQLVEALDVQLRLILENFAAIDKCLDESAKKQIENKEQVSETLSAQRALVVEKFAAIELQVHEAAKKQFENKEQTSETLNAQHALVVGTLAAIEFQTRESAKKQIENKEQVSETLSAQRALVIERFAAIELQAREADKQQSESRAQMSEHTVSVQRRLDRTANDFNKQIGKLSDALVDHMDNSRKHHRAMQAVMYACSIFVVLTLAVSIALLIKR